MLCLCFPTSALVSLCPYWCVSGAALLVRLSIAIFTSSQAMHLGDADEQILSCGNNPVLFLKHPVPGTGKDKLQGQRAKSEKCCSVFRINCEISWDSGCLSLAKEVQTVPVHFTFSYLSGTAIGQGHLTHTQ